jgi:sulfatase maturation enzyme AslB (radical SAM superfamily)
MGAAVRQVVARVASGLRRLAGRLSARITPQPAIAGAAHDSPGRDVPPQNGWHEFATDEQRRAEARRILCNGADPFNVALGLGMAPCNHSCIFCPQSLEKPAKAEWIDLALLEKMISEFPETGMRINISSYSETLANPRLVDAVRMMKRIRPQLPIIMATNGSLMRADVIEALMMAGLDEYQLSFDAATREDFLVLTQVDHFDKVWANLEQTVEIRNRIKANTRIITHVLAFQGREPEFERFKEYWQDKIDAVNWRKVNNWGGEPFNLIDRLAEKGFVPANKTPEKRYPCSSIFNQIKIMHDGNYFPCFAAVAGWEGHLCPSLGNAHDVHWRQAWNQMGGLRQLHLQGRWDEIEMCRKCNLWGNFPNIWLEKTDHDGNFVGFMLDDDIPCAQ